MSDYIKREDAAKIICDWCGVCGDRRDIMDCDDICPQFAAIPAADVEPVVRCKDCKYNKGDNKCLNPNSIIKVPSDFDYCSYGEKK